MGEVDSTVSRLCSQIYEAVKVKDYAKIHWLNIRLVQYRAKPAYREQAERTTENLRGQIERL
jgi:hypothetical protein